MTYSELRERFWFSYPCSLALAINHIELCLYLGEVRSVAQCKPFLGGKGSLLALFSDLTLWLFDEAQTTFKI